MEQGISIVTEQEIETAEAEEAGGASAPPAPRLQKLAGILRTVGAGVLLASAAAFLLQGWSDETSMLRYYAFLAFTVGLSAVGFFCGLKLREDKGARTCLAVAATMIPAHFLALGGLVYSRVQLDVSSIPGVVRWVAASNLQAAIAVGVASVLLTPLCYIAFTSLARVGARVATPVYLGLCAMLLIPTRDPSLISLLAVVLFGIPLYHELTRATRESGMRTKEGAFVRAMLFAPAAGLILRSLLLHGASDVLIGTMFLILAVTLFISGPALSLGSARIDSLQSLAAVPAGLGTILLSKVAMIALGVPFSLSAVLCVLAVSLVLIAMSIFCQSTGSGFRSVASTIAIASVLVHLGAEQDFMASLLCLAVSLMTLAYGYTIEQRLVFQVGILGTIAGAVYHVRSAMQLFSMSPWVSLAVMGVVTVVAASYLERNYREVIARAAGFKKRMSTWN